MLVLLVAEAKEILEMKKTTIKLTLKNVHCDCCRRLLEMAAEKEDFELIAFVENQVEIAYTKKKIDPNHFVSFFENLGFPVVKSRDLQLIETIKIAVKELIFEMNNADSIVQKSAYLVGKTGLSFPTLSKLFSLYEDCTLERYIIIQKIEKIKSMIVEEEYTLSEISYLMDYSSVHYLSSLFKKETGYTFTEYKKKYGSSSDE